MKKIIFYSSVFVFLITGCADSIENEEVKMLKSKIVQFAPAKINYDDSILSDKDKLAVEKLYYAARIMDEIFLEQVYSQNNQIKSKLESSNNDIDKLKLEYFNIMFGPFDRLDENKSFVDGYKKPLGANFYPENISKEEFISWIENNPTERESFISNFTVIRREGEKLVALPYSEIYNDKLSKASLLLREAAGLSENLSLKNYLLKRAAAFETNDYYESDVAWMDLKDHKIEIVIGPYEVYEDELFNYKAAFECFLTIVDAEEGKRLEKFSSYLTEIEKNLPYNDNYKNFNRGLESPIIVANEIFSAGDTKAGTQTLAFNLPNDERVRQAKGSKKVMLKNIHEAKFEKLLYPISKLTLDQSEHSFVTFDAFFNHTLMHEISHGVGPGFITVDGRKTEVGKELKETYSKIEECKADILGMYNNLYMIEKGIYLQKMRDEFYATFLGGIFRSIRFGIRSAHGAGNAIIYNYLLEKGAYIYNNETVTVKVNRDKIYPVIKELAGKILTIQAEGNYNEAKELIDKYAIESPSMMALRNKLKDLPVDIKPIFEIENRFK